MMNNIFKTLFALALVFCMSCGEEAAPIDRATIEDKWWEVESLSFCFMLNTASQKLWYIDYDKGTDKTTLHQPSKYKFVPPNKFSWNPTEELYGGKMEVVNKGDCWDLIYGHSRWESACKCKSIPQDKLDILAYYINIEHKVGS
tara:strand:+ start:1273 stop:1704 length:432 start_codon:yes stop_codon:yes gene_type:complete